MELTIILALFGNVERQKTKFKKNITSINCLNKYIKLKLICICDSYEWAQFIIRESNFNDGDIRVITKKNSNLAMMFNAAASVVTSEWCLFLTLIEQSDKWMSFIKKIHDGACKEKNINIYSVQCSYNNMNIEDSTRPLNTCLPSIYQSGWIEMLDIVPMHFTLVKLKMFSEIGGFIESNIMQSGFWWAFSVKASRCEDIKCNADFIIDGIDFPEIIYWMDEIRCSHLISRDSIARVICRGDAGYGVSDADLDFITNRDGSIGNKKIRLLILGGVNEPAHNQLCFFNYFQYDELSYKYIWRSAVDIEVKDYELNLYDIVIFSRVKSDHGVNLANHCKVNKIKSLYMLDDNWFSISSDWPEYKELLSPGTKLFDNFISCMTLCDTALTYNEILRQDIARLHSNTMILPININLDMFNRRRKTKKKVIVGYVGSVRREDIAFKALSKIAHLRDDFDIFIMSNSISSCLASIDKKRIIFHPYVFSYKRYAEILCDISPDILLAPLSNLKTDASKCPNKYLEITACGAAGIYSSVKPYIDIISNQESGVLVDNDVDNWVYAINYLIENPDKVDDIAERSYENVFAEYSTDVVREVFFDFIEHIYNY